MQDVLDFGIDVAKAELVFGVVGKPEHDCVLANTQSEINHWLKRVPPGSRLAVESTGAYHQRLVALAQPDMLAHAYRLSHPLGEWSIDTSLSAATPTATLKLDYAKHGARISVVENLRGKSGWLTLARLEVTAFETTEALLFSGLTDDGHVLDQETCEKLMGIPAAGKPAVLDAAIPEALAANSQRVIAATIAQVPASGVRGSCSSQSLGKRVRALVQP